MKLARWTKAQVVFFTGLNGWLAMYVAVKWAALCTVATAAYLAWLSPNEEPSAWDPPEHPTVLKGEGGYVDGGGLVLLIVGFLLGILCTKAHVLGL